MLLKTDLPSATSIKDKISIHQLMKSKAKEPYLEVYHPILLITLFLMKVKYIRFIRKWFRKIKNYLIISNKQIKFQLMNF